MVELTVFKDGDTKTIFSQFPRRGTNEMPQVQRLGSWALENEQNFYRQI